MSKATKRLRRAGTGGLTAAVALGTLIASTGVANATSNYDLTRVFGQDRYETSVAAVKLAFSSSDNVILASGDDAHTVDALGANYLAGVLGAPVLLTDIDSTPDEVVNEITALGAKNVWIVGGKAAVSEAQQAALDAKFDTVKRVAGFNRYETDKAVIDAGDDVKVGTVDGKKVAFVASGTSFADALSAAAISWKANLPVAITGRGSLDANAKAALAEAGIQKVYVLGGQAVISDDVINELTALGYAPERVYGQNRSDTSVALAKWAMDKGIISKTVLHVASGQQSLNGADALSAGAVAGKFGQGLVVTNSRLDAGAVDDFVKAHANELTGGVVFGGPTAIADSVVAQIEAAGRSVPSTRAYSIAGGKSSLTVSDNGDNAGVQQYTVTGLGTDKVDIVLADPANITVKSDGTVTFKKADGATVATLGTGVGAITVVNGVGNGSDNKTAFSVSPVNGQVTFTIDSTVAGGTQPVVFSRADGNDTLSVDANGVPTEQFGVGTASTYLPQEASAGNVTTEPQITSVNKDANYFVATDLYNYGNSGDTYFVVSSKGAAAGAADQVTLADFEASLSKGDFLSNQSVYNPSFGSKFVLEDVTPSAPQTVDAVAKSANSVKVSWAAPTSGKPDSYNVYRASGSTAPTKLSGYSKIGSVAGDAATLAYTDSGLSPETTYYYAVTAVVDGDESSAGTDTVATPAVTETVAPTITNTQIVSDADVKGLLGKGDSFLVDFSEAMDSGASTGFIRLSDGDSTYQVAADPLQDGPSSKGANDRMVVSISSDPTFISGKDDGLDFAGDTVKITLVSAAFTDVAGNKLDLAGSTDVVVDDEGAVDAAAPTITTAASPVDGATGVAVGTSPTITFGGSTGGTAKLVKFSDGSSVAGTATYSNGQVTFDPTADLTAATKYTVTFTGTDDAGNVTTVTSTFTTA